MHLHIIGRSKVFDLFPINMKCFRCTLKDERVTLLEAEDAKWLSKDELLSVDWLPADVSIIKKIKSTLEQGIGTLEQGK